MIFSRPSSSLSLSLFLSSLCLNFVLFVTKYMSINVFGDLVWNVHLFLMLMPICPDGYAAKIFQQPLPPPSPPFSHFPNVPNNLSPTSPIPGLIIPLSSNSSSTPATLTSVLSDHSPATFCNPEAQARTLITMIRWTPHSFNVWMAATAVPPVAMTGSRITARSTEEGLRFGVAFADGDVRVVVG